MRDLDGLLALSAKKAKALGFNLGQRNRLRKWAEAVAEAGVGDGPALPNAPKQTEGSSSKKAKRRRTPPNSVDGYDFGQGFNRGAPLLLTGLLSEEEATHIINSAAPSLHNSKVDKMTSEDYRTSSTSSPPWLNDPVFRKLDNRLTELLGIGPEMAESFQIARCVLAHRASAPQATSAPWA